MKSTSIRIVPVANMARRVDASGGAVFCRSGAHPGYRIHWATPERGPSANAEETPTTSEQLVNGEAYFPPSGSFREFWITTLGAVMNPAENVELRVVDAASAVVLLNRGSFSGYRFNVVAEGTSAITHPASQVLYLGNIQPLPTQNTGTQGETISRGWIAGGARATTPFQIEMYSMLDIGGVFFVEIARWTVDALDAGGTYSCSFEHGGRAQYLSSTPAAAGFAPLLLAWPPRGLRVTVRTTVAGALGGFWFMLGSRTGPG